MARTSFTLREYLALPRDQRSAIDDWLRAEDIEGYAIIDIDKVGNGYVDVTCYKKDDREKFVVDRSVTLPEPVRVRARIRVSTPPPLPRAEG